MLGEKPRKWAWGGSGGQMRAGGKSVRTVADDRPPREMRSEESLLTEETQFMTRGKCFLTGEPANK